MCPGPGARLPAGAGGRRGRRPEPRRPPPGVLTRVSASRKTHLLYRVRVQQCSLVSVTPSSGLRSKARRMASAESARFTSTTSSNTRDRTTLQRHAPGARRTAGDAALAEGTPFGAREGGARRREEAVPLGVRAVGAWHPPWDLRTLGEQAAASGRISADLARPRSADGGAAAFSFYRDDFFHSASAARSERRAESNPHSLTSLLTFPLQKAMLVAVYAAEVPSREAAFEQDKTAALPSIDRSA